MPCQKEEYGSFCMASSRARVIRLLVAQDASRPTPAMATCSAVGTAQSHLTLALTTRRCPKCCLMFSEHSHRCDIRVSNARSVEEVHKQRVFISATRGANWHRAWGVKIAAEGDHQRRNRDSKASVSSFTQTCQSGGWRNTLQTRIRNFIINACQPCFRGVRQTVLFHKEYFGC